MIDSYFENFNRRDWQTTTSEGTVRFAIVGIGWWTTDEAIPAMEESELCKSTIVVSSSRQKIDEVVSSVPSIERGVTYEEFSAGVASEAYDAVYVVTPNATHLEYVEAAASLEKDVLCEKPMEADVARSERLVSVCDRHDVGLMIAYRMQTDPLVRRSKALIDAGFIGEPVQIHSGMSARLLEINDDTDQWRLNRDLAGGCALVDLGIYSINTIRFLLDDDPVSVYASLKSVHDPFSDVDEHASFELQFGDELQAVCTASHNAYGSSHLRITGREGQLRLESLYHPWMHRTLTIEKNGTESRFDVPQSNQMTEEFDYFAECVLSGAEPHPNGAHGLKDMQIIEGAIESAQSGEIIDLHL